MPKTERDDRHRWRIALLLAVAAALLVTVGVARLSVDNGEAATTAVSMQQPVAIEITAPSDSAPVTAAGRQIFIDVETGEIMEPTLAQRRRAQRNLSPDTLDAMSTSHQGLVEEVMPDGSARVDLRGRFHSASFATVDEAGEVAITHAPPPDLLGTSKDGDTEPEDHDDH